MSSSNKIDLTVDFKVFIRDPRGRYLAEDDNGLFFSTDRTGALILNYRSDQVERQLEMIRLTQGIQLVSDPVPAEEIYETCDRCKELFPPVMVYFSGKSFLCPDCARLAARRSRPGGRKPSGP